MRNKLIKILSFALVFCIIFYVLQNIFIYRWSASDDSYSKNIFFQKEKPDSIDVLFFGTSEIYEDLIPMEIYNEEGITSFNFATSWKSGLTSYYLLRYALKYQTPKVVVCDFAALFEEELDENLCRKTYETLPDNQLKEELLRDICAVDPKQKRINYYFPLLQYHSMWNDLSDINFKPYDKMSSKYLECDKGSLLNDTVVDSMKHFDEITADMWTADETSVDLVPIQRHFYDKMIELCSQNGITVIALIPPKLSETSIKTARWDTMKRYFDENGVVVCDYNNYEKYSELGLDYDTDYYDDDHLTKYGARKLSGDFAGYLKDSFDLPDRRGELDNWNLLLEDYYKEHW